MRVAVTESSGWEARPDQSQRVGHRGSPFRVFIHVFIMSVAPQEPALTTHGGEGSAWDSKAQARRQEGDHEQDGDDAGPLAYRIVPASPLRHLLQKARRVWGCGGEEGSVAWQDSEFITECVCWHNVYRQRHGAPPLAPHPPLCLAAQAWANRLAHTERLRFPPAADRQGLGHNVYGRAEGAGEGGAGGGGEVSGQEAAAYWYGAQRYYRYGAPRHLLHASVNAGPFTQLVWAGTQRLGCGRARSRSGKVIVVAVYAPKGNVPNLYHLNVFPPLAAAPLTPLANSY